VLKPRPHDQSDHQIEKIIRSVDLCGYAKHHASRLCQYTARSSHSNANIFNADFDDLLADLDTSL